MVNPILTSSRITIDDFEFMKNEFGVQYKHNKSKEVYLAGTFSQVEQCHSYITEKVFRNHDNKSKVFQTVPTLLKFITCVPMYSRQLQDIENRHNVMISFGNEGNNVIIKFIPGCNEKQFQDGCANFVNLYQKVLIKPIMLKELALQPGPGSTYRSVDEVVHELSDNVPVLIGKSSKVNNWQFYGQQSDVENAIHEVCKLLCITKPSEADQNAKDEVEGTGPAADEAIKDNDDFSNPAEQNIVQAVTPTAAMDVKGYI